MNPTHNHHKDQWYFQYQGEVIGPVSRQVLLKNIRTGIIKPDTLIKTETELTWTKAESLKEIFVEAHAENKPDNSANAAAKLLSNMHHRGFQTLSEEESADSFWSKVSFSGVKPFLPNWADVSSSVAEFLVEKLSILKYGFKLWVILPLLLLVVSGLCIKFFAIDWYHQKIAYETYSHIWEDLQRLRDLEIDEHQWDSFKVDTKSKIASINSSIEKAATIQDPYSMELLRAGRDYLPRMLDDARKAPSASEKKFAIHMQKAARYAHPQALKADSMNIVGILFVIFDTCLIGWGAFLLIRKIRS
ncbi:DUF4339 domain-containing protein [Gimesia fumaroli]|uniref:GYF domain-containing protein n=1 Tax=Gimesia fumaroli TaxID=2527976 RepID=A0A518I5X9_9PLAN|nr:DUF4339 domain-containing protein [Gimesia fumaroli]QDV48512.1 hypothetical protein Enr17x_05240 [Gimesia fumaroli]